MKKLILIFIIITILFSCERKKISHYNEEVCNECIDQKIAEINKIIETNRADTCTQCRLRYFFNHGCGPVYVYGINNVDTTLLNIKFDELDSIKRDCQIMRNYADLPTGSCGNIIPNTFRVVDGKCIGYLNDTLLVESDPN
jgi:hypothetical protein